jgi:hypothetical protein
MARPLRIEYPGAFYHITSRGNERKAVFKSHRDRQLNQIEMAVDSVLRSDKKLARQVKLYFCHRYSGKKLRNIGSRFEIGESGETQASRRISIRLREDKNLRKAVKIIEEKIPL